MTDEIINVLLVEAEKRPRKVTILNDFGSFRKIVSPSLIFLSDIDFVRLEDNVFLVRNEEGVLLGLQGNRRIKNEIIAGTFLVIETDSKGKIKSISDKNTEKYIKRFWKLEKYNDNEVSDAYWSAWLATTDGV